jgi:hypothetical protein
MTLIKPNCIHEGLRNPMRRVKDVCLEICIWETKHVFVSYNQNTEQAHWCWHTDFSYFYWLCNLQSNLSHLDVMFNTT